ncbi:hypothetical protein QCA50_017318 [Cerrena zonata]|uniref:Shugoshin C-terminal domain-containing protein n=1 Tax=Cerrena zonata TaxID=2478898 RepID=A0AAW0FJU6_9APHY
MSRRQSRVSLDARQNDTLLEFENFKKKFLLANKHITKLNSHLSVRIEELNAQISDLHVENLRLRASEIALSAQLKKEREKSRRVLADAEAATHSFMKQLGHIRKLNTIPHGIPISPEAQPPPPRARRPIRNPNASPPTIRVARVPTVPGIAEDDENVVSSAHSSPADSPGADPEDEGETPSPTPVRRKSKSRASSSRLPVRQNSPDPPPPDISTVNFENQLKYGKRKPTRRQSGLLTTTMSITTITERPPSPAFGSPLRREVGLQEEEEEVLAVIGGIDGREDEEPEIIAQSITRRERKKKPKDVEQERESGSEFVARERERKRPRDSEEQIWTAEGGKKSKLKDVTNSPPGRLPALDIPSGMFFAIRLIVITCARNAHIKCDIDRERLHTPEHDIPTSATSASTTNSLATTSRTFLTTPATTPAPSLRSEPQSSLPTPRSSSPLPSGDPSDPSEAAAGGRERRVRKSVNYAEPKLNTKMRKPDPPPGTTTSRRSSTTSRRSSEMAPAITATSSSNSTSTLTDNTATQSQPGTVAGTKRKKSSSSRVLLEPDDDEESDGTQADAEFGGSRFTSSSGFSGSSGWVNTESRRRSIHASTSRKYDDDDRRHSMAV